MKIISRSMWGPNHGRGYPTDGAKTLVVVHHDGPYPSRSQPGMTLKQEIGIARTIEDYHVNGEPGVPGLTRANPRIAYSFLGMQTGRVFEGCGFGYIGAHTGGHNSSAYGYFLPLCGSKDAPTPAAIAAFHEWRREGVRLGHLSANHIVKGHQDFNKPACPGKLVYDAVVLGVVPVATPPRLIEVIRAHPSLRLGKGGKSASFAERAAVTYLQQRLIAHGFLKPKLGDGRTSAATGYFGTVTDFALKAFQRERGLKPDGICGSKTWAVVG